MGKSFRSLRDWKSYRPSDFKDNYGKNNRFKILNEAKKKSEAWKRWAIENKEDPDESGSFKQDSILNE